MSKEEVSYAWDPVNKEIIILEEGYDIYKWTNYDLYEPTYGSNPDDFGLRWGKWSYEESHGYDWVEYTPEQVNPEFRTQLLLLGYT